MTHSTRFRFETDQKCFGGEFLVSPGSVATIFKSDNGRVRVADQNFAKGIIELEENRSDSMVVIDNFARN